MDAKKMLLTFFVLAAFHLIYYSVEGEFFDISKVR